MSEDISFEELLNNSMKSTKKLEKIEEGKVIKVSSDNEIFVDLNYKADGIVPKTEYSFDENDDPHNEFKPGDKIRVEVLKLNDGQGNVALSYKRIKKQESQINFWNDAEIGKEYLGTVSSVCSYGAFIDINGVQGLLHISEMSWDREANASDIVKQGQTVKVTIKELDKENKRMKLSYAGKGEDPWIKAGLNVGDVVKVKIKKLVPFGAFAEVKKGIEGLIHISQISEAKIAKPEDKLQVGEKVNAKIIDIDIQNKKLELSIKELEGTNEEYSSKQNI